MDGQKELTEEIIAVSIAVLGLIAAYFKKLRSKWQGKKKQEKIKRLENEHHQSIKRWNRLQDVVSKLAKDTGAMNCAIIHYDEDDVVYKKKFMPNTKMTMLWEDIGQVCDGCMDQCANYKNIPNLIDSYSQFPVTGTWLTVALRTLDNKKLVTSVMREHLQNGYSDYWDKYSVHMYKERYVKVTKNGWLVLGLFFCKRLKKQNKIDGLIINAASQIKTLI